MSNFIQKIILLFVVCGGLAEAVGIKTLVPRLPVDDAIQLKMDINEFQRISQTSSEVIGPASGEVTRETRVFGEDVERGEISLSSAETIHYYFVKGRLARLEWKNKTGKLSLSDARDFKMQLESNFGVPERVKRSFFGGKTGVFQATEEIYRSFDGIELQFVASMPFFLITVTDVHLLKNLNKSDLFYNINDDYSIKEWEKNSSVRVNESENELDYLLVIGADSGTRPKLPISGESDGSIGEQLSKIHDKATAERSSTKSDQKQPWLYLLGAVAFFAVLWVAVKAWKSRST